MGRSFFKTLDSKHQATDLSSGVKAGQNKAGDFTWTATSSILQHSSVLLPKFNVALLACRQQQANSLFLIPVCLELKVTSSGLAKHQSVPFLCSLKQN